MYIDILVIGLLISAITTIFSRKIEFSIFSMIATFAFSGLLFIFIGIPFFGFIYLIVYTAAISILFLFVLMMLTLPQLQKGTTSIVNEKLVLLLSLLSASTLFLIYSNYTGATSDLISGFNNDITKSAGELHYHNEWAIENWDTMQGLAYVLYTEQVSLLILISIVLLIVMVGIINHLSSLRDN